MQQTLVGCAFCDAPPGTETGEAHTWGQDERVTHPICVDCAIQTEPDPDERDLYACDSCGLVVDTLAALTRFRVELGHLEGPVQLCERCSPGGLATYLDARPRGAFGRAVGDSVPPVVSISQLGQKICRYT